MALELRKQHSDHVIILIISLGKWTKSMADIKKRSTLTSSGQSLEQRPLRTAKDRGVRIRQVNLLDHCIYIINDQTQVSL